MKIKIMKDLVSPKERVENIVTPYQLAKFLAAHNYDTSDVLKNEVVDCYSEVIEKWIFKKQ